MDEIERNRELIRRAGGPVAVGRIFGIAGQAVSGWYAKGIPPERVIAICEHTSWKITPHEARPDIYPNVADGLPAHHVLRQSIQEAA